MQEVVITILIFFGVILVTAVVFGGWLIVAVVRLISRALGGFSTRTPAPPAGMPTERCAHPRCRAINPAVARFCRRCGKMLRAAERPAARKVAMG